MLLVCSFGGFNEGCLLKNHEKFLTFYFAGTLHEYLEKEIDILGPIIQVVIGNTTPNVGFI